MNKMHWVLSNNVSNEIAWDKLLETLAVFDIPFSEHKVIPFIGELLPDPPSDINGGNVIVIGPYSMRHVAKSKCWTPGSFDLDPFDFQMQRSIWPYDMLNADSVVCKFKDLHWSDNDPRFIRPCNDSKFFAGGVYEREEFANWQKSVVELNNDYENALSHDTLIQAARCKKIYAEYRCWVVKGKIVTMSLYKRGDSVIYINADSTEYDKIRDYAQSHVDNWQPLQAFVIDVCEIEPENDDPSRYKIVELNTINASGFYACDMQKLVFALQDAFST